MVKMKTFKEFIKEHESIHPMINVDGVDKHRNNSTGEPIHHTDDGIKSFHKWFGDSKIVDQHGRPKVMYHGTNNKFDKFGDEQGGLNGGERGSYYFSKTKNYSKEYGKHIVPVYLKAEKELKHTADSSNIKHIKNSAVKQGKSFGEVASSMGYDHMLTKADGKNSVVMYKKEHIKHAKDNNGSFSGDSIFLNESIEEKKSLTNENGTKYSTDGGYIDVQHKDTKYSPRKQSIVDFVVDDDKRGQGIGSKLIKHALSKHDDLGGQASSTASVKVMYNHGFRHPTMPEGSFDDHEEKRKQDSSIYMAHKDTDGNKYVK